MKKILLLTIFGFCLNHVYAQMAKSKETRVKTFYADTSEACNPDMIFSIVENMPSYKGGLQQLESDLNGILDLDKNVKGSVFIAIHINCKDKAYSFQVLKGLDDKTNEQLIEQLQKLQNWTAGVQREKKIDCLYNMGFGIKKGKVTITNK